MTVTCSLCDAPQEVADRELVRPLVQAVCAQCAATLVIVRLSPGAGVSTARPHSPRGPSAPTLPQKLLGLGAATLLGLFNFAVIVGLAYFSLQQLKNTYDPYEVDEYVFSSWILKSKGWTDLHLAAARGQAEHVAALLNQGHSVEARNDNKRTPLYEAAKRGRFEVVQLLVERGANLEARGKQGYTPLLTAVGRGHIAVVQLLLAKGASINARCDCGSTALHEAVRSGHAEVAMLLLEHGADVNARASGKTALQLAEEQEQEEIADLLRQRGGKILHAARDHLQRGYEFYTQGQLDQALAEYDAALAVDPNNAETLYYRGVALIKKGAHEDALAALEHSIQLDPTRLEAYLNVDWILAKRGEWDRIIAHWSRLIELQPDNARAYYERGGSYFHKGDRPSAVRDAETACRLGHQEACKAYAQYNSRGA